jgi:hypothetical protein
VHFDLHGLVQFDIVLNGNVCSTFQQGHFSIVVESNGPSQKSSGGRNRSLWKIVVPCLVGGIWLLVILGVLVVGVRRAKQWRRRQQLECEGGDWSEILQMKYFGDAKTPFALGNRTRPMIENNFVP